MKELYDFLLSIDGSTSVAFILGASGLLITFFYNNHSRKMAHDKMEKELFKEFNERYDQLNEFLEEIVKFSSLKELQEHHEENDLYYKLSDYFNLCAEEFYWHKKGRIDGLIWNSWKKGMDSWYNNHPIIQEAWNNEIEQYGRTAFYMGPKDRLFKAE